MVKGLTHWADILIVVSYFIIVIGVGLWSLRRPNRGNVKSYFLAGRSMPWFAIGASLFSSNIGSEHFVGLAGAGASSGISMVLYEWFVIFLILLCAWLFLPVYISAGVYTLPEYIEKRHGGRKLRTYLCCIALVLYVVSKLAVSIFAGSMFIQMTLGWDMYLSIIVLLVITGVYTILGGLTAVMYTDTFQTTVMILGSLSITVIGFQKVGGLESLKTEYMEAIPKIRNNATTCGIPKDDAFQVFLDPVSGDYPWPGLVLQSSLGCLWYWCCDQVIVQRSLGAKNLSHAKGGSILAGYLKTLPLFLIVFPGMISRVLYPDEVGCVDPEECSRICDNPVGCSNIAYPKLVLELLPVGLRGLLMAVMVSAIMSSLTSIFNSSSTVFTMDIWRRIRVKASQRELLIVGSYHVCCECSMDPSGQVVPGREVVPVHDGNGSLPRGTYWYPLPVLYILEGYHRERSVLGFNCRSRVWYSSPCLGVHLSTTPLWRGGHPSSLSDHQLSLFWCNHPRHNSSGYSSHQPVHQ
ncbi:sodium/glucose cotransporter 4-like isoform X3 [Argopecten irradians]|uniref:sodium/glucose cotransporter 4-like isoform X3 n=1 Tax=Argopecten irradians TaxID=31199 RepID=UPI003714099E